MTTNELFNRGIGHNCLSDAYELGYNDAIDECIDYLIDYFGCTEATKYGNKTREQQEISYNTWMNYEIKEGIEELKELKCNDVTTKKGADA